MLSLNECSMKCWQTAGFIIWYHVNIFTRWPVVLSCMSSIQWLDVCTLTDYDIKKKKEPTSGGAADLCITKMMSIMNRVDVQICDLCFFYRWKKKVFVSWCEFSCMDQCEEREEGVAPSKTPLYEEQESKNNPQRSDHHP